MNCRVAARARTARRAIKPVPSGVARSALIKIGETATGDHARMETGADLTRVPTVAAILNPVTCGAMAIARPARRMVIPGATAPAVRKRNSIATTIIITTCRVRTTTRALLNVARSRAEIGNRNRRWNAVSRVSIAARKVRTTARVLTGVARNSEKMARRNRPRWSADSQPSTMVRKATTPWARVLMDSVPLGSRKTGEISVRTSAALVRSRGATKCGARSVAQIAAPTTDRRRNRNPARVALMTDRCTITTRRRWISVPEISLNSKA